MSFWSGETLAERLPSLISPFEAKQIDCAAYTLRVGPEAYVSPSNAEEAATRTRATLEQREDILIPPGQFTFLLTEERIKVPANAIGFISMKARIKFRGLVNVSGFHVDPGYQGRLVLSVYNAGPSPVHLSRGDDCFLIWFADLDRQSDKIKRGGSLDTIGSDLINPISGEVQSLTGLSKRIEAVEREHKILITIGSIAITLMIAILVRSCAPAPMQSSTSTTGQTIPAAPRFVPIAPQSVAPARQAVPLVPQPASEDIANKAGSSNAASGSRDGRGRP